MTPLVVTRAEAMPLGPAPGLTFVVELEELGRLIIVAQSREDEMRVRRWVANPAARESLVGDFREALEEMAT